MSGLGAVGSPLRAAGSQDAELVAVRIGHGQPAGVAHLDPGRAECKQPVDFGLRLAVGRATSSKCNLVMPTFGINGGPPHVIFGPPRGDRIAVSWSWSHTSGQPSASLQK